MPNPMILDRFAELRDPTYGVVIFFPNEVVNVPDRAVRPALGIGAKFADETTELSSIDEHGLNKPTEDSVMRMKAISDLIPRIVARNNPGDFTAAGLPRVEVVGENLSFRPTADEVRAAYRDYYEAQEQQRIQDMHAKKKALESGGEEDGEEEDDED